MRILESSSRRLAVFGLVLSAICVCLPARAQDAGALRRQLFDALSGERWEQALVAARNIVELDPSDATSHYNLACVLARKGETEAAVESLLEAARLGFSSVALLRSDTDLASLRDHPGYLVAVELVEAADARRSRAFKERTQRSQPLIYPPEPAADGGEATADGKLPMVVFLHGRGGRAEPMAQLWRPSVARIGAVLVVPEAFEPFGNGFQWGVVEDAIYQVEHAIEYAAARYPIDRERVIIAGFSQGAYVSLVAAARDPRRFAGVVAIGACDSQGFELDPGGEPFEDPPPIYLGIGSKDRAYENCRPMAKLYEAAGFAVKLRVYKGYGHVFPQNYEWEFDRALRFVLEAK